MKGDKLVELIERAILEAEAKSWRALRHKRKRTRHKQVDVEGSVSSPEPQLSGSDVSTSYPPSTYSVSSPTSQHSSYTSSDYPPEYSSSVSDPAGRLGTEPTPKQQNTRATAGRTSVEPDPRGIRPDNPGLAGTDLDVIARLV